MEAIATPALLQIMLAYEELALVLRLVNASTLPGLLWPQAEPPTREQQMQSLIYAERSLRARELARLTADGQLVVQAALLSAVSVCAHAQQALVVQHFRADGTLAEFYGAQKDGAVVTHTQPEPGLYRLSVLQDAADLVAQALSVCEGQNLLAAPGKAMTVADETLRQARELAEQGAVADAAALLATDNDAAAAATMANVLATPHAVSILMLLERKPDATVSTREITVLHTPQAAWLMTQLPQQAGRLLRPITSLDLFDVVIEEMFSDVAPAALC